MMRRGVGLLEKEEGRDESEIIDKKDVQRL